jgi:outer membrane murein-binding lipoprotein Lpp
MTAIRWASFAGAPPHRQPPWHCFPGHLHMVDALAIVAILAATSGWSMSMNELNSALERLAERCEALESKIHQLDRENKLLRQGAASALQDIDALLRGRADA